MLSSEIENSSILLEHENLLCLEFYPKNVKNSSKNIYIGEVNNNKEMNGYGKLWNDFYSYHGYFKNNKLHGEGILKYIGKSVDLNSSFVMLYKGNFVDNKKNGYGYELYCNKEFYKGSFFNDLRHGNGTLYNINGETKIESLWELGKSVNNSFITEYYSNGCLEYRGEYDGMHRNGKGVLCNKKGEIIFDGILKDGIKKEGKIFENNFIIFQGTFKDGYPSNGTFYHNNGIKLCSAEAFICNKSSNDKKVFCLVGETEVFNINGSKEFSGELLLNSKPKESKDLNYNNLICNYIEILDGDGEKNKYWYTYGTGMTYYDNLVPSRSFKVNSENLKYEGKFIKYWENSNIHEELNFVNGILDGEQKTFDKNEVLGKIINYKLGLKHGNEIYYNESNCLKMNILYDNDIPVNLLIYYKDSDNKLYEGEVNNSLKYNGVGKLYYDNDSNSINYQGSFLNHKFNDNGIIFYQNGNKSYDGHFVNGKKNGIGTSYYESTGTIEYSGEWVNDEKHGEGSLFTESGEIVYNGNFHYDEMSFGLSN